VTVAGVSGIRRPPSAATGWTAAASIWRPLDGRRRSRAAATRTVVVTHLLAPGGRPSAAVARSLCRAKAWSTKPNAAAASPHQHVREGQQFPDVAQLQGYVRFSAFSDASPNGGGSVSREARPTACSAPASGPADRSAGDRDRATTSAAHARRSSSAAASFLWAQQVSGGPTFLWGHEPKKSAVESSTPVADSCRPRQERSARPASHGSDARTGLIAARCCPPGRPRRAAGGVDRGRYLPCVGASGGCRAASCAGARRHPAAPGLAAALSFSVRGRPDERARDRLCWRRGLRRGRGSRDGFLPWWASTTALQQIVVVCPIRAPLWVGRVSPPSFRGA
jgi:hypothetical protein